MPKRCFFCPLFICVGVGGNLVAIQASRISTYLHFWSIPGVLPYKMRQHWPNPFTTFFSSGNGIIKNRPYNTVTDWPSFINLASKCVQESYYEKAKCDSWNLLKWPIPLYESSSTCCVLIYSWFRASALFRGSAYLTILSRFINADPCMKLAVRAVLCLVYGQ